MTNSKIRERFAPDPPYAVTSLALMSLEAGEKLAHYEIVEPIGKGGMDSPRLCQEETFLPLGNPSPFRLFADRREGL